MCEIKKLMPSHAVDKVTYNHNYIYSYILSLKQVEFRLFHINFNEPNIAQIHLFAFVETFLALNFPSFTGITIQPV